MADSVQKTKDEIWLFRRNELTPVESEYAEWAEQLVVVDKILATDPNNAENLGMKASIEEEMAKFAARLEPLREKLSALEAKLPKAPEPKFDPEKHPLLRKTLEKNEPAKPVVFNTGDMCEALWTDKQWYKAKIQTILGAASAPKYHVKFVEYDDSMTVDRENIRPLVNKRKRDPEAAPAAPSSAVVANSPHVISGPASINPDAQRSKQESEAEKPMPPKRTIGSTKALGNRVNQWKDWNSKGVGKKLAKKDSMFRSGTTVNSRVGFTGSGAGMRETHKRVRHNTKQEAEEDDDAEGGSAGRRQDDRLGRSRF